MFQTKVEIPDSIIKISYHDQIMTLGSCFADNIGRKMQEAYFETEINPFGVLYNPISILRSVELLIEDKPFTQNDLFQHRGLWQSFSHSTLFSDISPEKCLEKLNERFNVASASFQKTDFLVITFGTAWVFEEKESGSVVSNCHKLPANRFIRRRLAVEEIVRDYSKLITQLTNLLPSIKLIFSVSPVRHWKDGAHENNVSKSILLLAIDELQRLFKNVLYFPAYEIQMDELRDYRFYAADMIHPSDVAVETIWQRFSETFFSTETLLIKSELEQLNADLAHRPLHPESVEFRVFQRKLKERKAKLVSSYVFLSKRIK
jgi:hypothetical protein